MKDYKNIVIASAIRTPFGRFGGSLSDFDYFDLGAYPMAEVIKIAGISGEEVDEVYWGVGDTSVCKDVYTPVAARQTLLKAGLPYQTPSISLDKACVSAMSAVHLGCRAMKAGEISCAIGGGATSFSRMPLILRKFRFSGYKLGNVTMEDPLYALGYKDFAPVAVDAGKVALKHGVGREMQDEWAFRSHHKYGNAFESGKFDNEIMPLNVASNNGDSTILKIDEQYRPDVSMEKLARLKTVYGSATVTAGNAPGLNDGAAAILFMTDNKAHDLGIEPLARIVAMSSVAVAPDLIAEAPAHPIRRVIDVAGLALEDIAVIEINEAFAVMPLVVTKLLSEGNESKWKALKKKTNVNGSAIATGHPNTASGARVMMNLTFELRRRGGGYAIGAICGGLGQADACLLQV